MSFLLNKMQTKVDLNTSVKAHMEPITSLHDFELLLF